MISLLTLSFAFALLILFGILLILDSHLSDPHRNGTYQRELVAARSEVTNHWIDRTLNPPRNLN